MASLGYETRISFKRWQPLDFATCRCHGMIFGLYRRMRNCGLLLRFPWDRWDTKHDTIAGDRATCVKTPCPVIIKKACNCSELEVEKSIHCPSVSLR